VANTLSAQQRARNSARKAIKNRIHRSRSRTLVKSTRELIAKKDIDSAKAEAMRAISSLDRAAGMGVIHPNNAARRKARLMKLLHKVEGAKK
jgi:small subunit ribosomal protein S20